MPRSRWTLTRPENSQYRKIVERLRAGGAVLDLSAFGIVDFPWIKVTHFPAASLVRTRPGASAFIIHLRLVSLAPRVIIQEVTLVNLQQELGLFFPSIEDSQDQLYRLCDGSVFHPSEVLNHHLEGDHIIHRGDTLEGKLLVECLEPIPNDHPDKGFIPIQLAITNQFDEVHLTAVDLQIERIANGIQRKPLLQSTLYDVVGGSRVFAEIPAPVPRHLMPTRLSRGLERA